LKKQLIFILVIVIISVNSLVAQIVSNVIIVKPTCNNQTLGNVTIKVTNNHPPYTFHWSNGNSTSEIFDLLPATYSVKVTDGLFNDTVLSITVKETACELSPEIVFTPNDDGYNDTWFIGNANYFPNAYILIYNRVGQKVYEYHGLYTKQWDGKDLIGAPVPDASYYWIIFKDKNETTELQKGCISIIR